VSSRVSARPRPSGPRELFVAFTLIALQGFGGVLAVAQRGLCEDRRWLTREEFLELLALGQVLPGPNVCNVALMIGDRFHGWRGAFAALGGMITVPLILVLVLSALYTNFSHVPVVAGALKGMGAVAAGMIIGTALRLSTGLRASPLGLPACLVFGLATFVLVALLRMPLVLVLLGLGILACSFAWWRLANNDSGAPRQ
jgi:chromate transporter